MGAAVLDAEGSDVDAVRERAPCAVASLFAVDGPAADETGVDGVARAGLAGKLAIPVACFTRPSL